MVAHASAMMGIQVQTAPLSRLATTALLAMVMV